MIAYKGVGQDYMSRLGGAATQYRPGLVVEFPTSKTARSGLHCCENPFDCLDYYSLQKDRFLKVEAMGSIDEAEDGKIACTQMRVVKELDKAEFFIAGMAYMKQHPKRSGWEKRNEGIEVAADCAEAEKKGDIAIARGRDPRVLGVKGSYIGLIKEDKGGVVKAVALCAQSDGVFTLDTDNELLVYAHASKKAKELKFHRCN